MKYLKHYQSFLGKLNESLSGKEFILLSGPSASGKTFLATDSRSPLLTKIEHWYDNPKANKILVGTDNFMGGKYFKDFQKLLLDNRLVELSKFTTDWQYLIEEYRTPFEKWLEIATEEEQMKYEEVKSAVGFSKEKTTDDVTGIQDGRVCGMAWVAYLSQSKTIVFDDIKSTIKKYIPNITEVLVFTPLDWYLQNIQSRNLSEDDTEHIDVNEWGTALYQYCNWFQATDKPDLDNKLYTPETVEKMLIEAGHNNPKEILKLLGVSKKHVNGFYLTTAPGVRPKFIINSRDLSTGSALDADTLTF